MLKSKDVAQDEPEQITYWLNFLSCKPPQIVVIDMVIGPLYADFAK